MIARPSFSPTAPKSTNAPTGLVFRAAAIAALGGLLFGFDTAVISGAEKSLQPLFHLSDFWIGFTVATALIGTIVGSITIEGLADA
jgi:SP family xylose:H+ symportor-like MFS transporter